MPDLPVHVTFEATISPSEDPVKVAGAVANVAAADRESVSAGAGGVRLVRDDQGALARLRDQLRDRHVRSVARRQFLVNGNGRKTSIMLNRQAAAAGVIAVCGSPDESPLGPIYLTISSPRLEEVVDWLTAHEGESPHPGRKPRPDPGA